ncbi:MAG: hypothetical protein CL609_03095 [Anaerolineaceae bacterium]|nr:hypothetical protein [Anaerolineaceae bacterium]
MNEGIPIQRQFVLVSNQGNIVIDWGSQQYQDVFSGEYLSFNENQPLNPIQEADLIWLKNAGIIHAFNVQQVYFSNLPQPIKK